jgi:hypothetical protein
VQPEVELEEDVLLARKVVVERRLGDLETLGDIPQRGLVVSLPREQLLGDSEDPFACLGAVTAAGSCHLEKFT